MERGDVWRGLGGGGRRRRGDLWGFAGWWRALWRGDVIEGGGAGRLPMGLLGSVICGGVIGVLQDEGA